MPGGAEAGLRATATEQQAHIHDLDHEGRGVARVEGKVVFIRGGLPGETVRFVRRRARRGVEQGELVAIEQVSPDRRQPRCPHFGLCGGCSLQHLSPGAQRHFKQKQLLDALERIGRVVPARVAEPVHGPDWGYRRRARLSVKFVTRKGRVLVGFREAESPFVAQLEECHTLDARVGMHLRAIADAVGELELKSRIPQIEVAAVEDAVVLVFRVMEAPGEGDRERLRRLGNEHGYVIYLQTGGLHTVSPLDPPGVELLFTPDGSGLQAEFRPTDFIQVNDVVNRKMVGQALDWIAPRRGESVLELFAGVGNFSLPLAAAGARVTTVEGDAALAAAARRNASRNGLEIRVVESDLFEPDPAATWLRQRYDAVLLDPPRAGAREVLPAVVSTQPARILYVSCHPGTLARDAAYLVQARGYRLSRAGILDMFPHTSHVESMALFEKAG